MRAVIISTPGGYSSLTITDIPLQTALAPDDVLIDVAYAGVNFADCLVRLGLYKSARDLHGYPLVPGFDFSGVVARIGSDVTTYKIGDKVFGVTLFGAYQTQLKVHQNYLRLVPDTLTLKDAASLPTAFLTAYYLLAVSAHVQKGDKLLVRSIGGGVGHWLGILGMEFGAEVSGTVSTKEKSALLATREYKNLYVSGENIDATFDVIANAYGGETIASDLKRLHQCGRLILYGFHGMIHTNRAGKITLRSRIQLLYNYLMTPHISPFTLVNQNKSVTGFNLSYLFNDTTLYRQAMSKLLTLLHSGTHLPPVQEIPLEEVEKAHYLMEQGKTVGKIVLKMNK